MRVIVAGAADWTDAEVIARELARLPPGATEIHGDAPGADALAGAAGARLGFRVEPMAKNRKDYARYRRGAWKGLNERMLASEAVVVLAFHADLVRSRGTKHLVELARAAGIEVRVFGT
jgi:hypothetical protein